MYGSNTGPSQPEWRLTSATTTPSTATSHNPPQPSWQANPPLPARPTPNHGGSRPNTSSPVVKNAGANVSPTSNMAGMDPTSWGVKYNRQQFQAPSPPPLPPRPPSTTQSQSIQTNSSAGGSLDVKRPSSATPVQAAQDASNPYPQWSAPPFASHQQTDFAPTQAPPPPPIPFGYQGVVSHSGGQTQNHLQPPPYSSAVFNQPHDSPVQQPSPPAPIQAHLQPHSSHVIGHPETQSPWVHETTTSIAPELLPVAAPPVPPKTNPTSIPTSASALSPGTPSAWEHLLPTPGNIDDVAASAPKREHASPVGSGPPSRLPGANSAPHNFPSSSAPPISDLHTGYTNTQLDIHDSPVSVDTVQDDYETPLSLGMNARVDGTESIHSSVSTSETVESIDGVIEAWTRPLKTNSQNPDLDDDAKSEHAARKESKTSLKGTESKAGEVEGTHRTALAPLERPDPFDDLDTWSKSSLERYVAMLRKEATADTDSDRFEIFTSFMAKEAKLREVLYGIEPHSKSANQTTTGTSPSASVTPTAHANSSETDRVSPPVESGLCPVETEKFSVATTTADEPGDGSYSPGGRPILRLHTPGPASVKSSPSHAVAPSVGAQMSSPRPALVPPTMIDLAAHKQDLSPLATNPPQPIYAPFRYTEGPQRGSDALVFDRPAYQAYSALRQASAESGRVMSNGLLPASEDLSFPADTPNQAGQDETFIGLIREKSIAYRKTASQKSSTLPPLPASLRQGRLPDPLDELRSIVSSSLSKESVSGIGTTTKKEPTGITSDFTYIHEAINTWVASNKSRRDALEKERVQRQEESERHIDALFNAKEIGYADINVLEEEFRQKEARCQLEEERQELNDFIAHVFDPLDKRLEEEVLALQTDYEAALAWLDDGDNTIQETANGHSHVSKTMKIVNEIYRDLEARYQKRLEIALDRERRRKKAERRPLVFMGDSTALRRLDQEFDQMEKRNKLEATRERDARANRLMDSFDDVIMHGLGENQRILDDITAKVSRIDAASLRSSPLPESEIVRLLKSVNQFIDCLREDSESILENFGIADAVLNDADYGVSVAEARCSDAETDVFRQLEAEKQKEDKKIQDDLESKLESVREGPAQVAASINNLLRSLGHDNAAEQSPALLLEPVQPPKNARSPSPGSATKPASGQPVEDNEHQERLRKALENAKKRNAARKVT
ncbi:uncharacterized protein BO72DRAFT_528887 [Aspergillus fijiensis CBS 313.89]|uniref:Uncharacterized protein n=1 Tax=Aspergillus fijiensis CBS 313.89 TaxID=1448319 RepID=A0A8G1RNV6_9EURO|nr:uncharacterized protein BO72DRAFT_528887 [Aspergillus fijiensis CBS 313.89]RAK76063.1 hypothetical protein BO72DRAFT_528887 [Aspergillus fijiensis CBS 313.89]